jgi:hypothetical protein
MTIVPDDKDWTWVLGERCPGCGVAAAEIDPARVGTLIRYCADRSALGGWGPARRARPGGGRPRACAYRFPQKSAVLKSGELRAPPQEAARRAGPGGRPELAAVARSAAAAFDGVQPEQLHRPGRRSDGAAFTVASFSRYFIHDPLHHLVDVGLAIDDRPAG